VVLFGGRAAAGDFLADTWGWDGEAWTQLADTGPSARNIPGMASDPQRKRIICFGGNSTISVGEPILHGDTWEWDGSEWTEREHEGIGPSARQGCAMAYDFPGARALLFGGLAGTDVVTAMRDDTWAWDGVTWSQVAHTGPTRRFFHAMTAAPTSVVLFGGQGTNLGHDAETWEWVASRWVQRADFGPPARHSHGIAFDSVRHRVVVFGGAGALLNDTWESASP
jgi:hypothetical protein